MRLTKVTTNHKITKYIVTDRDNFQKAPADEREETDREKFAF